MPAPQAGPRGRYDAHLEAVQERWSRQQVEQDVHRDDVGVLTERELRLVGAAIYWAEGAKTKPWNRAHRVVFIDSDTTMVEVFLAHLALVGVPRSHVCCRVHIHQNADVDAAETFWRAVVGEDVVSQRTTSKTHDPKTARSNRGEGYRGCLGIVVHQSAVEYRRIAGTWEGIATAVSGGDDPPWSTGEDARL